MFHDINILKCIRLHIPNMQTSDLDLKTAPNMQTSDPDLKTAPNMQTSDPDLKIATDLLHQLTCGISCDLMREPVIVIPTGQTYDKENIKLWLATGNKKCPNTNQPLTMTVLIPNIHLCGIIQIFVDTYKDRVGDQWEPIRKICREYLADLPIKKPLELHEPNRYMHPQSASRTGSDLEQKRREWDIFEAYEIDQRRAKLLANETPEQKTQRETQELAWEKKTKETNAQWIRQHTAEYRADFERQQLEQVQSLKDKRRVQYEKFHGIC